MEAPDEEAGLGLPEDERLLEITLISAQGLKPPSGLRRRLQAYAVAWVDAVHRLQTRTDAAGGLDPAWHARLLFRVHESALADDSRAAVTVEIYAAAAGSWHLGGHSLVGSARFLLGDHRLLSRPVGSPSMFAVGVRRPSGRVHGLLNLAASLVAVPPSAAASHALRLSPAVSLSGLSVTPNPSRVLRVLNRAHPTPPSSPKVLTPKKQQFAVKPNNKGADDGSDDEGDEEATGMGGVMFCGPCVLPFPRKIHSSPSDENLQAFAGIFSDGLRHCRTEPSLSGSPCE
uniref:C2 domain-containing protein n=1 Tax=Arundo donax TaxID=35708 RepID=A0A0A9BC65_ARUDO